MLPHQITVNRFHRADARRRLSARLTALAGVLVLAIPSALAEVRIRTSAGRSELVISPAPRGVWSPSMGADPRELLNPEGDTFGDGFPVHAGDGTNLLVAWLRPQTASIVIVNVLDANVVFTDVPAPGSAGTPVLTTGPDGNSVVWQVLDPEPHVNAMTFVDGAASPMYRVADGYLLEAFSVEEGTAVVTADVSARLASVWVLPGASGQSFRLPILPLPIPSAPVRAPSFGPLPINPVPVSTLLAVAAGVTPINPVPVEPARLQITYESMRARGQGPGGESTHDVPQVCVGSSIGGTTLVIRTGADRADVVQWVPEMEGPRSVTSPEGDCLHVLRAARR